VARDRSPRRSKGVLGFCLSIRGLLYEYDTYYPHVVMQGSNPCSLVLSNVTFAIHRSNDTQVSHPDPVDSRSPAPD
jgi:hypothetical protein